MRYLPNLLSHTTIFHVYRVEVAQKVLRSYSHVMLCRDMIDGSLREVLHFGIKRKKEYTIIRLGLAIAMKHYSGGTHKYTAFSYLILKG